MTGGWTIWLLLGGVLAASAPGHAAATQQSAAAFRRPWYQAYDEGVRAVQQGDWPTAIAALEEAKRAGPAPGRRVLFQGDRVDVFNPDYYLGLAYNATKRFAEADAAFARVRNDKLVVQGDRLFDELQKQTAVATYEQAMAEGARALSAGRLADAEKIATGVLGSTVTDGRATDLLQRIKDASQSKTAYPVETTVAQAPPPQQQPPPADPKADSGGDVRPPVNQTANAGPETTGPTATAELPPARDNTPPDRAKTPGGAGLPTERLPSQPQNADAVALSGATAYYQGDYQEAIRILAAAAQTRGASRLGAFYLACAQAALVARGQADASTLDDARQAFATARGSAIEPHLRFISPRVLQLLGDVPATAR
ncbi:MAG: hypothetical protein AB7O28_17755 [Vicinamibacterales bacterium]